MQVLFGMTIRNRLRESQFTNGKHILNRTAPSWAPSREGRMLGTKEKRDVTETRIPEGTPDWETQFPVSPLSIRRERPVENFFHVHIREKTVGWSLQGQWQRLSHNKVRNHSRGQASLLPLHPSRRPPLQFLRPVRLSTGSSSEVRPTRGTHGPLHRNRRRDPAACLVGKGGDKTCPSKGLGVFRDSGIQNGRIRHGHQPSCFSNAALKNLKSATQGFPGRTNSPEGTAP